MERGAFTPAEIKMLVDAAEGEWKTLIQLAYYTGARLSDCCRMEWQSVDLAKGVLTYTQGKTGATVILPIHPELDAHLGKLAANDRPERFIMPGMANKGSGGRHGLSESLKEIMRKAGVDSQPVKAGSRRAHPLPAFVSMRCATLYQRPGQCRRCPGIANETHRPHDRGRPSRLHSP